MQGEGPHCKILLKKLDAAAFCGAVNAANTSKITLGADHNRISVSALFDSGSSLSFLSHDIATKLKLDISEGIQCVASFSGEPVTLRSYAYTEVYHENENATVKFWILHDSPFPVILGTGALRSLNVVLDFSCANAECKSVFQIDETLCKEEQKQMLNLLTSFSDVFSKDQYDLGHCTLIKYEIDVGDNKPFKSKQYPIPEALKPEARKAVAKMLESNIIRPSKSAWSNPFFFVKKSDGSLRFVIDFRKLNSFCSDDCFPIPLVDDLMISLRDCQYFTSLDLTSGYHQVELEESSKEKTAFILDGQLWEFNRLPFGLKGAPPLFQRMMQIVLSNTGVLPYIDDVILASPDFKDHISSLKTVLERFREHNLKVKPSKCYFAAKEIKYLGFLVSKDGIKPDPEKVSSLLNMSAPTTNKEVERLCGFINYLSRFVPHLASLLEPVFQAKKSRPFQWTEGCQQSFERIKEIIANNSSLRFPDFSKPLILSTDASAHALGAYLHQDDGPISFASRSLNRAERNYSATDREFLALVWGIKKFRQYLYGRNFECRTDHKPLLAMLKSSPSNSRHARYLQQLEEYNFQLNYIPGKENVIADALSRLDTPSQEDEPKKYSQASDSETCVLRSCSTAIQTTRKSVVPEDQVLSTIRRHHEYGHLGVMKTHSSILNSNMWFPCMFSRIRRFINQCLVCAQNKSYSSQCKSGNLPKDEMNPFEVVSIDIVGPLKTSINNHRYVLTMIDNASRWAEAVPLTNIRADTISKALTKNWIHRFGAPRHFLSDCGTQFTSAVFKELAQEFKFHHKHTTIFHPQGNSVVERLHREIKDRLRCISGPWSESLQEAVWHHNRTSPTDSNRCSPFQYLFGRPASIPIEWPDNSSFLPYLGKCPKLACPRNFGASSLDVKFFPPVPVLRRISEQLLQLVDGRVLHFKNCKVIW